MDFLTFAFIVLAGITALYGLAVSAWFVMYRNQSVSTHQFSMVPRSDIPRSKFNMQTSHKTTFNAGKLVPIYVDLS